MIKREDLPEAAAARLLPQRSDFGGFSGESEGGSRNLALPTPDAASPNGTPSA